MSHQAFENSGWLVDAWIVRTSRTVVDACTMHRDSALLESVITTLVAATLTAGALFVWDRTRSSRRTEGSNWHEAFPAPRRCGACIPLRRDQYLQYRKLHDDVWEAVLERMYLSHIRNFVIYYHEETSTLFQSFEWIGHWYGASKNLTKEEEQQLFQRDMEAIGNDPVTREWWKLCEPCQIPFSQFDKKTDLPPSQGGTKDWWSPMECVCHTGHWPVAYSPQRRDPDFLPLNEAKKR
jgi:L-rhamnose mutarotase